MRKILIIEDEISLLESIKIIIEVNNFIAITAPNGIEGLKILHSQGDDIDLILCDINMPDITGYEVLKEVKAHPTLYKVPFIFLTAFADKKEVRKGMDMGADDYLTKPFSIKDLINTISSRIELSDIKESKYREEISKNWISILNANFKQEFYTPLNGILNTSYYPGKTNDPTDAHTFKETMRNIYFSSFRMHRDTKNLMLYSMMNANQSISQDSTLYSTSLSNILNDTLSYYSVALENYDIMLHREIEPVDILSHDSDLITVLFTELIDNTIKFNHAKKTPEVKLHAVDGGFYFSTVNQIDHANTFCVKDINPFTKFHKDESLNGLGLGLYVCKKLCQLFNYSFSISVKEGVVRCVVTNLKEYSEQD